MSNTIHVLIADDEDVFVNSLRKVLARKGIEVRHAHDGKEAVDMAASEEFDVIVLDVRMPGVDGVTALEEIRRRDVLTPVLLLTGNIDLQRARSALKAGVRDILLKPCPVETLVSAIENAREWKAVRQGVS